MKVETYEVEVLEGDTIQQLAQEGEALTLREELGLADISKKEGNENIFRFRSITEEEKATYSILFPKEIDVKKYDKFIPLEAMQALKEFKETCPHKIVTIKVWDAKDYDPDPVLIAGCYVGSDDYSFVNKEFIIARWGLALKPLEELIPMAIKKYWTKRRAKLLEVKMHVDQELTMLEINKDLLPAAEHAKHEPYINL